MFVSSKSQFSKNCPLIALNFGHNDAFKYTSVFKVIGFFTPSFCYDNYVKTFQNISQELLLNCNFEFTDVFEN